MISYKHTFVCRKQHKEQFLRQLRKARESLKGPDLKEVRCNAVSYCQKYFLVNKQSPNKVFKILSIH